MAMFVHLTTETRARLISKRGMRCVKYRDDKCPRGVFAVPITRNFYISHQWLRELKRTKAGSFVGIYFRIPDSEKVYVGHYHYAHRWMTAAEATAEFLNAEDAQGWQVIIPRRIETDEIHRMRMLPQVIGWRFSPTAKGKPPFCTCKFCVRGEYGSRRMRDRLGSPDD